MHTDAFGSAQTTFMIGPTAGTNVIVAHAAIADASVTFMASGVAGPATTLLASAGDAQVGVVGSALAAPFVATAQDSFGNPVADISVDFVVITNVGSVSVASVTTDASGQARTILTLGTEAGPNRVAAGIAGLHIPSTVFAATGLAGVAAHISTSSGDLQTGLAATALESPLVVRVEDASHNFVPGAMVTFVVANGGGSVDPATALTDAEGRAQTVLTLGPTSGRGVDVVEARTLGTVESSARFTASSLDFATPASFAVTAPTAVAVCDINRDGKPDVVVTRTTSNTVSVFLNTTVTGSTTTSFSTSFDLPIGADPQEVAIGDFNNDGKVDLAIANYGANTVSVIFGETTMGATVPSFATRVDLPAGTQPRSIATADIDGDGKIDLVVGNYGDNTVSIFRNLTPTGATSPSFAARVDVAAGSNPISVAVADFNGDGKPDIAVSDFSFALLLINTSTTSTPTFSSAAEFATGVQAAAVVVADFNGDGKPDLAVANTGSNNVSILLDTTPPGATIPTFRTAVELTDASLNSVAVADFDGDGRPDLATVDGSQTVSLFLDVTPSAATTPVFSTRVDVSVGTATVAIATGDFNSDGKQDIVVTDLANRFFVLLGN